MNLKDWTKQYIKHKNLILQNLKEIKEEQNRLICTYKTSTTTFYYNEKLEMLASAIQPNNTLVCLNTKFNVDWLIRQWNAFCKHEHLTVLFVNPETNKKWHICPYTHDKIVERAHLKKGVLALYQHSQE